MRWSCVYAVVTCKCGGHVCMRWSCVYAVVTCVCGGHVCMQWSRVNAVVTCVCGGHVYAVVTGCDTVTVDIHSRCRMSTPGAE